VPPFFIVGCPRSGTTLLRKLLVQHPRLAIPSESHFIPLYYRAWGEPRDARDAEALAARLLALPRVKHWGLDLRAADFRGDRSFAQVVARLYTRWCEHRGKARWGDKTPQYVFEMPLLSRLFPGARFLHVVRDGRDVALSLHRIPWGPRTAMGAAELWRRAVRAGRAHAAAFPDDVLEVRYESLLAEPQKTLSGVCAFLGETFHEEMLQPSREPDPWATARGVVSLATSGRIVADNAGKWQRELAQPAHDVFLAVAGDEMTALGYPSTRSRPLPPLYAVGCRIVEAAAWTLERLRWLRDPPVLLNALLLLRANLRGRVRCLWRRYWKRSPGEPRDHAEVARDV
jgi:hypothetical protein